MSNYLFQEMRNNTLVATLEKKQYREVQTYTKDTFVIIHFSKRFTKLYLMLNFPNTLQGSY